MLVYGRTLPSILRLWCVSVQSFGKRKRKLHGGAVRENYSVVTEPLDLPRTWLTEFASVRNAQTESRSPKGKLYGELWAIEHTPGNSP